jgi:threonine dehydratase
VGSTEGLIPSLEAIEEARARLVGTALRTPLVKLHTPEALREIYLKLENLQPGGSFKIRGAYNAIARFSRSRLQQGVLTASAGNMAQGVAHCARALGVPCTVIAPDSAPQTKIHAVERLGARVLLVPFERWWQTFLERSYPGVEGIFIHAFDDLDVMAGNGTIGLEILEDLPDVEKVIVPWGGGGLSCGIASAVKALKPSCRVFAAEVETAAPLKPSLEKGEPKEVEYVRSFVDGIGSRRVFPIMLERAQKLLDGSLVASLAEIASAIALLVDRHRVIAEGAGAASLACALAGEPGPKVVCVVSGGNLGQEALRSILAGEIPQ